MTLMLDARLLQMLIARARAGDPMSIGEFADRARGSGVCESDLLQLISFLNADRDQGSRGLALELAELRAIEGVDRLH